MLEHSTAGERVVLDAESGPDTPRAEERDRIQGYADVMRTSAMPKNS